MKTRLRPYSIYLFLMILMAGSCGGGKSQNEAENLENDSLLTAAKTIEYRVIELYANLTANPTFLEGIWESACLANNQNNSFNKIRRIYHLDGIFREVASFNDINCTIKNSRNTIRLFGTITNIETLPLFNGEENIEVQKITSNLMSAPIRGFAIPLQDLTLDDLSPHSVSIEAFRIVENRFYVSENFGPNSYTLLGNRDTYLVNNAISTNDKSEAEIDQLAINLFNPNGLN